MKKFLAVLLSLVMAFSFCLPAFAEDTTASGGGNKGGDSPTTTKKSTTSKGGSSTSKGKIPQTGDVALFSVAGVAVAAGIALVLTKKKKEDK